MGQDAIDGLLAGMVGVEDLTEEGPEGDGGSKDALAEEAAQAAVPGEG